MKRKTLKKIDSMIDKAADEVIRGEVEREVENLKRQRREIIEDLDFHLQFYAFKFKEEPEADDDDDYAERSDADYIADDDDDDGWIVWDDEESGDSNYESYDTDGNHSD